MLYFFAFTGPTAALGGVVAGVSLVLEYPSGRPRHSALSRTPHRTSETPLLGTRVVKLELKGSEGA